MINQVAGVVQEQKQILDIQDILDAMEAEGIDTTGTRAEINKIIAKRRELQPVAGDA